MSVASDLRDENEPAHTEPHRHSADTRAEQAIMTDTALVVFLSARATAAEQAQAPLLNKQQLESGESDKPGGALLKSSEVPLASGEK